MKNFLLFLLILFPITLFAQEPPKGSNTIIVQGVSFQNASELLLDAGYSLQRKDTSDKTLLTDYKIEGKAKLNYRIHLRVKDSTAFISGQYKLGMAIHIGAFSSDPQELKDCQYTGWRTGANRITFAKLQEYAESLHGQITYAKL